MLKLVVSGGELWDERSQEFVTTEETTLVLEHSLVSLSKWESIVEKPFLGRDEKTTEETLLYIMCMITSPEVPPEVFSALTDEHFKAVNDYINAKMTATWFSEEKGPKTRGEVITSEIIYYWMFTSGIPIECETWHLNRLLTLIRVFSVKNAPQKKSTKMTAAQRTALNEARRKQLNTRG